MASNKGVHFVRIHGRVVAIHDSQERKKGAAAVAAGIGTGVGAGVLSAKLHREGAHHDNAAETYKAARRFNKADTNPLRQYQAPRAAGQFKYLAAKNALEGKRFTRAARLTQRGGFAVSSTLLGMGTYKLIPHKVKKENPNVSKVVSVAAGLGSAFLVRSAFYRTIQPTFKGMYGSGGKKSALWEAVKLAVKRVAARGTKGGGA